MIDRVPICKQSWFTLYENHLYLVHNRVPISFRFGTRSFSSRRENIWEMTKKKKF